MVIKTRLIKKCDINYKSKCDIEYDWIKFQMSKNVGKTLKEKHVL